MDLVEGQVDVLDLVRGLSLLELQESIVRDVQLLCFDAFRLDERGDFGQLLDDLTIGAIFLLCLQDLGDIKALIVLVGFETDGEAIAEAFSFLETILSHYLNTYLRICFSLRFRYS